MLRDRNSSAIVAVTDIERARRFYGDMLGLEMADGGSAGMEGVLVFRTGATILTVYRSEFAGTNQANAVTFAMDGDLRAVVDELTAKGVVFERYDLPDMEWKDGVHEAGEVKLAWFKDPDGNLLHLIEGL
ncbi:VOC family protein [Brevundimonas vitis]|uniref:VOC family protein n=1 Tax=Brevundimonas vitisensis TaxID=2800818 RepID=A0ABX7BPV1_9CAUL|nr:VOC family protein [Brevundimonas vitisensis]QQQ19586.1 VOC family protein [Brevundimonas vitisensis]